MYVAYASIFGVEKMSFLDFIIATPLQFYERRIVAFGNRYKSLDDRSGEQDIRNKVVVITGATSGLGKCVALQMAKRGAVVVMCCRDLAKANITTKEIGEIVPNAKLYVIPLDVSDMDSVKVTAREIIQKFPCINILINNAGIMTSSREIERTSAGYEKELATNHLGHMLLTMLLLGPLRLGAPSRIICVGSSFYSLSKLQMDDLNWEKPRSTKFLRLGPHNDSKRCCMLFVKELSRRLEGYGVKTYALCPGLARTDITNNMPTLSRLAVFIIKFFLGCRVEQGAATILYCALAQEIGEESGQAYHFGGGWPKANADLGLEEAEKMWKESEKLLSISFDKYFTPPSQFEINIPARVVGSHP